MTKRHEMLDRFGREIDDAVIPEGGRLVVPMCFADSSQKEMHDHLTTVATMAVTDADGDISLRLALPGTGSDKIRGCRRADHAGSPEV
jgi:hypothetical protein